MTDETITKFRKKFNPLWKAMVVLENTKVNLGTNTAFPKGVTMQLQNEVEAFISEALLSQKRIMEKKAISILTEDISKAKFIDNGRAKWKYKNNRGIEPCRECENRNHIIKFLDDLLLTLSEGKNLC